MKEWPCEHIFQYADNGWEYQHYLAVERMKPCVNFCQFCGAKRPIYKELDEREILKKIHKEWIYKVTVPPCEPQFLYDAILEKFTLRKP